MLLEKCKCFKITFVLLGKHRNRCQSEVKECKPATKQEVQSKLEDRKVILLPPKLSVLLVFDQLNEFSSFCRVKRLGMLTQFT